MSWRLIFFPLTCSVRPNWEYQSLRKNHRPACWSEPCPFHCLLKKRHDKVKYTRVHNIECCFDLFNFCFCFLLLFRFGFPKRSATVWHLGGINLPLIPAVIFRTFISFFFPPPLLFPPYTHIRIYLMTSRIPSAMMNISRATSPRRQIMSPGVKIEARILSTRSCRNSGWHSLNMLT